MIYPECENCVYKNCMKIPPTPMYQNDLMIIGEAPGQQELLKKVPFVGRSGQLLRQTMLYAGLPANPYITNSLLCMPNKVTTVNKQAILNCRPRLLNEIEQVKPKMIIALGNVAIHALTGNFDLAISTIHAKAMKFNNITVIPIFHPAAILRNMKNVQAFKDGFVYASELFNGGSVKNPGETEYFVADNNTAEKAVKFLLSKPRLLFSDIETGGLNPYKCPILCSGHSYEKNKVIIFPDDVLTATKPLYVSPHTKNCWQRGQFDTWFLRVNGYDAKVDHDTILQHYTLDESEGGHDLKALAIRFLGAEDYEKEVIKYKKEDTGYATCPRPLLYKYLAFDCDYEGQLCNIFLPQIEADPDLKWLYYSLLLPGINFLRRVTMNGFYVNKDYTLQLEQKLKRIIWALEKEVIDQIEPMWNRELYLSETKAKSAPESLNLKSTQQMAWILYDLLKIKPTVKAKPRCIDIKVIDNISYMHPFIPTYVQMKKKQKELSTYVKSTLRLLGPDGRLRSSYSLQTAVTGRLSSSKPNLQNIKRNAEIKNMFGSPPNRMLIDADYKGVELRVIAHVSDDPSLIDIFVNDRDPHNELSIKIFGPEYTKEQRVAVKGLNFGIPYGREALSIAEEFGMSERDAQVMIDEWLDAVPVVKAYLKNCEQRFLNREVFTTPFGRKRRWGLALNDKHLLNEAKNFAIQSIASDLTFISAMLLEKPLKELDAMIVNLVHDSIIIEAPNNKEVFEKIVTLVHNTMESVPKNMLNPKIPFPAEVSVGKSWGELKEI